MKCTAVKPKELFATPTWRDPQEPGRQQNDAGRGYGLGGGSEAWSEARHRWSCYIKVYRAGVPAEWGRALTQCETGRHFAACLTLADLTFGGVADSSLGLTVVRMSSIPTYISLRSHTMAVSQWALPSALGFDVELQLISNKLFKMHTFFVFKALKGATLWMWLGIDTRKPMLSWLPVCHFFFGLNSNCITSATLFFHVDYYLQIMYFALASSVTERFGCNGNMTWSAIPLLNWILSFLNWTLSFLIRDSAFLIWTSAF